MNLLEKLDLLLNESGIRNISKISKYFDRAIIYFHQDLDGVTSAIGLKSYLERYGIKVIDAHPVQYGNLEYKIPPMLKEKGLLFAMVDFAHVKPVMHIWTDHHDVEHSGMSKDMSVIFTKTPSNAMHISQVVSPSDLFPPDDIKMISMIDSAAFAGLTPDDIMQSVFKFNKRAGLEKNKRAMGFVVNKLTLAYKNKPDFLKNLVLQANPSLKSMYNVILKLIDKGGYQAPEEYQSNLEDYVEKQKSNKIKNGNLSMVKDLKNGESMMIGNTIVQYGGGNMRLAYDRYTPFKNWPTAHFLVIAWPMGMIQVSKNPFIKGDVPVHLGELCNDVLDKFRSSMESEMITLGEIKRLSEIGSKDPIIGFTFDDFIAIFGKIKGSKKWLNMLHSIANIKYSQLSPKQKEVLDNVKVSAWDIVKAQSGGHRSISNIQLSMIPGSHKKYLKDIFYEVVKAMIDKKLVNME